MNFRSVLAVLTMTAAFSAPVIASDTVPIKAVIDTQPSFVGCVGPVCQLDIPGSGEASHMGNIQAPGESTINLATLVQTGSFTLIAANGDSLSITFAGTFLPTGPSPDDPVSFSGTWTVVSGTGRFAGEAGDGTYHGTAAAPVGILFLDGEITAVGSNKK